MDKEKLLERILSWVIIKSDGCCQHCVNSYYKKFVGIVCDFDGSCKKERYKIDCRKLNEDYDLHLTEQEIDELNKLE